MIDVYDGHDTSLLATAVINQTIMYILTVLDG